MAAILLTVNKNMWYQDNNQYFEWSGFQMVGKIAIPFKIRPFEIRSSKIPDFKCFKILNYLLFLVFTYVNLFVITCVCIPTYFTGVGDKDLQEPSSPENPPEHTFSKSRRQVPSSIPVDAHGYIDAVVSSLWLMMSQ